LSFYPTKDTFDAVPIPTWFVSESVPVVGKDAREIRCVVDENRDLSQVTAVVKLAKGPPRCYPVRGRIEPETDDFFRFQIDGTVQLELLAVKADHFLVDREVIRRHRRDGCNSVLCIQLWIAT
jgi:hypothetical protein